MIAREVAAAYNLWLLPPITISCSHEHASWPGTVSISSATLSAIVTDVASSLHASGIDRLVIVSGHGGNYVLSNVVQESAGRMALYPAETDWARARLAAGLATPMDSDMHAGELETSILLHTHPGLVGPDYAAHDHLAEHRDHMLTLSLAPYTKSGVVGRPSLASAEKGELALANLVDSFAGVLVSLGLS